MPETHARLIPTLTDWSLFAQNEAPWWQGFVTNPLYMITVLIVLFYVMVLVPERRNRNQLAKRLTELKKNDRVVTVGGLHGTIVNTTDGDTVVVRIDENNNTRVHINRSAISRVVGENDEETKK